MYGPQTSDLANALMAERHRHAAQIGLERSARRSRPSRPGALRSDQSITAMVGAALAGVRITLFATRPRPSLQ